MKKLTVLLAVIIIFSLVCTLPTLFMRTSYEASHTAFEVGLVLTDDMTRDELFAIKEGGINLLVTDESASSFDDEKLSLAKELGFCIAPRVFAGDEKSKDFQKELDLLVKTHNSKYLILSEAEDEKSFLAPIEDVIRDNNLTLVVSENKNQLSNKMPKGYTDFLDSADGRIMRSYETLPDPLRTINGAKDSEIAGELLYHHMANSLVDRNTEFITLNLIDSPSLDRKASLEATILAAKNFKQRASELGYEESKPVSLDGYEKKSRLPYASALMVSCIMVLLCIEAMLGKRCKKLELIFSFLSVLAFGVAFLIPQKLLLYVPSLFAPLVACFAFSITMAVSARFYKRAFGVCLLASVGTCLLSLLFGASFLSSLLADKDYYLNNLIFRGVKLSLLLPVAYAVVFGFFHFDCQKGIFKELKKASRPKIKPLYIVALAITGVAVFVYIARSGNTKISLFESTMRNLVSEMFGIRPRTKEFLVGWPLLCLCVYLIKYDASKLLKYISLVGSSILFASVANTFCHVFTDFATSVMRTVYGLILSVPISAALLCFAKLIRQK